jgi:hypothetical protein
VFTEILTIIKGGRGGGRKGWVGRGGRGGRGGKGRGESQLSPLKM